MLFKNVLVLAIILGLLAAYFILTSDAIGYSVEAG
jgi:hypothetical protein